MKSFFILLLAAVCFTSPSIKAETGSLANDHIFGNAAQFWRVSSGPAATVAAVATKAAAVGVRHVVDCITATLATDAAAQTPLKVYFQDGTTKEEVLAFGVSANSFGGYHACDLKLAGSKGNAISVGIIGPTGGSGAGAAGSYQVVRVSGYDLKQ